MISRIITAILGIPILGLVIGFGRPWSFFVMMIVVTGIALWEYFAIVFPGRPVEKILGVMLGLLVFFGALSLGISVGLSLVLIVGIVGVSLLSKKTWGRLEWSLLGWVYIGFLFSHWVFLYETPAGKQWVFFVLLVIMAGDTAGYFVGTRFGRRKIYPRISPNKTLEGTVAVLIAGVLTGLLYSPLFLSQVSLPEALVLSFLLSVLGQVGDLFESWIKRSFSVKDSSALLPGHGGILDRMDSLVFPTVVTAHYVKLFHS